MSANHFTCERKYKGYKRPKTVQDTDGKKLVNGFLLNFGELGLLSCCGAFVTEAGLPEIIVRIETSIVAIAPKELKSVPTYGLILHGIDIHWNCMRIKLSLVGPLAYACGAMTLQPKVPVRVGACMPVAPLDTNIIMLNVNAVWGCDPLIRHARDLTTIDSINVVI